MALSPKIMAACQLALALVGLALSLYSAHVERRFNAFPDSYEPLCDIDVHVSCTEVFSSEYSRMAKLLLSLPDGHPLDQSNSLFGAAYYMVLAALVVLGFRRLAALLSVAAMAGSLWLFYVLLFIIQTVCVVCMGIHVVNSLLLVVAFIRVFLPRAEKPKRA